MEITFDPVKRARTLAERGLDFRDAANVFAGTRIDERHDYGKLRWITVGYLGERFEFFEKGTLSHGDVVIRRGRPPSGEAKQPISLRLDVDLIELLRALGPGWQARAAEALRELVAKSAKANGAIAKHEKVS